MISMRCNQLEVFTSPVLKRMVCNLSITLSYPQCISDLCYILNILIILWSIDGHVTSRISFNRGASWSSLTAVTCVSTHLGNMS